MMKQLRYTFLFLLIAGCVEPYEFVVRDEDPGLVVEAFISDKSFDETVSYPSDGRYFTVKLSLTGDVTNTRQQPVSDASVSLLTSDGEVLPYSPIEPGIYKLLDNQFRATKGLRYKLAIVLKDESTYESDWESMPEMEIPSMGEIGFAENEKQLYVMEAGKWVLRTKQIVSATIDVPDNTSGESIHYRWTFSPLWVYVAPLIPATSPVSRCWATDPNYLNDYTLQIDHAGDYKKVLFDFPTVRNERIFEKFSVLVVQHAMTQAYYNFWKEMKDRNEGSALMDIPPYNLETNLTCTSGERKVFGYFGVTAEQARRWYFDKSDLSYSVRNTLQEDCLVEYGPDGPAEECLDCRAYSSGNATVVRPSWWAQ